MKALIVEDDFVSRKVLLAYLRTFGECDVATTGCEALEAFLIAHEANSPYDLITLDIMMPEMNGQEALNRIRQIESESGYTGAKIIMTTALRDSQNVMTAFKNQCEGYLVKPIMYEGFLGLLRKLGLIE
ncbi:MAG: response regulator [Deltaproteobacteria bacterium]